MYRRLASVINTWFSLDLWGRGASGSGPLGHLFGDRDLNERRTVLQHELLVGEGALGQRRRGLVPSEQRGEAEHEGLRPGQVGELGGEEAVGRDSQGARGEGQGRQRLTRGIGEWRIHAHAVGEAVTAAARSRAAIHGAHGGADGGHPWRAEGGAGGWACRDEAGAGALLAGGWGRGGPYPPGAADGQGLHRDVGDVEWTGGRALH